MTTEPNYYFKPITALPPDYLSASIHYASRLCRVRFGVILNDSVIINYGTLAELPQNFILIEYLPWELVKQIRIAHNLDPYSVTKLYSKYLIGYE